MTATTATGFLRSEVRDGGVTVVTLDRPRANAIHPTLVAELRHAVADAADAPALVLASSQSLFSAGWDLPTVHAFGREEMSRFLASFTALMRELFVFEGPLIAALPGHAIAGGLILASGADERIAAEGEGQFGLSEVALGVPIPRAAYEVFRYMLGDRGAERLAAAGDNVSGARALEIKRRVRAETLARFDRAAEGDPFLDFWFSEEARRRIDGLVSRLTKKT